MKLMLTLAVALAAATWVPSAEALVGMTTTFDGATTSLGSGAGCTGGVPPLGPVNGCYTGSGAVPAGLAPTCAYTVAGLVSVGTCSGTMNTAGTYSLVNCSNGILSGSMNLTASPISPPTFNYTVILSHGSGTLVVDPGQAVSGSGWIDLQPVPASPPTVGCVTTSATGWTFLGFLHLEII